MPLVALLAAGWTVQMLPFTLVSGETARKPLPATTPGGIAVFDYDGDGRLDLFFPNCGGLPKGPKASNALLRNLGRWKFADVTRQVRLEGRFCDMGAAAGDYDQDGRVDLLVAGLQGITLYRNQPDGTFSDVTAAAGLDNRGRWAVGAAWFDLENDGDLDLFVVNYVGWNPATERQCLVNGKPDFCHPRYYDPLPNALFRNDGGAFTDISEESGIGAHAGKGMAVAPADFDGDGFTDLFVTNDRVFAFFFHNRNGRRFEESAFAWNVAAPLDGNPVSGMGVDAQDWDNDGRPDLIYTALRDETFPLYRTEAGAFEEAGYTSRMAVLSRPMSGWGVVFADLDNDGWKDIVAARSDALSSTGGRGAAAKEPPGWFRNLGNGKFSLGAGWEKFEPAMYRGAVAADFDGDGCLDVALTALNAPACILRNPCAAGSSWLKVEPPGPGVRVRAGKQWRHVSTAVGYGSSYAGPLHFGLGGESEVEVEILWPGGHRQQLMTPARRIITVRP
jgi:hypothetical protein